MILLDKKTGTTIKAHGQPTPGGKLARRALRKQGLQSVWAQRRANGFNATGIGPRHGGVTPTNPLGPVPTGYIPGHGQGAG